ncbi:MAG: 2-dehydropantoate 2-reductase [Chloroflexota bacterium]
MRLLIYGGGAVGLGLASCLIKAGQEVMILARPETASQLRQEGLLRTGVFGQACADSRRFTVVSALAELPPAPFDHILVCTKSFDSEQAAQDLSAHRERLGQPQGVVLFQNGWGNTEIFERYLPAGTIYNASVLTGFTRPAPNRVEVTVHAQPIRVGSLYSPHVAAVTPLCQAITAGDIPCQAVPGIEKDLWAKMLFNCPLNPLSAILGVTYGALGASEQSRAIMEQIIREMFGVIQAGGYATHWTDAEVYLAHFFDELIPRTAGHYASTLQDLQAGKRTEIDALNGAIVRLGARAGVAVPANEMVYRLVKFLEGKRPPC